MGRGLVKIKDKFFEWSTIVDAPISWGMSLDELTEHIKRTQGEEGLAVLAGRLERIAKTGTSFYDYTLEELLSFNRAGLNEVSISENEIYKRFQSEKSYSTYPPHTRLRR